MKQTDLQPCAGCGKGVMHAGSPVFYRATISPMVVNLQAVRRQHGLETMLGSPALAHVMGSQEDLAAATSTITACVCMDCAITLPLAVILDAATRRGEPQDG